MGAPDPEAQAAFIDADCHLPPTSEGFLSGLTFAVKDNFAVAGTIAGCGNPDWAATQSPARVTAPTIDRLRQAGAALTGLPVDFDPRICGQSPLKDGVGREQILGRIPQ